LKRKDQEHFRRPTANPLYARQMPDHLFVRQPVDGFEIERAVECLLGEIFYKADLHSRQTTLTHLRRRHLHDLARRRKLFPGRERNEPIKDRIRGFDGKLLAHDRLDECLERPTRDGDLAQLDPLYNNLQYRVALFKVCDLFTVCDWHIYSIPGTGNFSENVFTF
jgi:hypothetical protein